MPFFKGITSAIMNTNQLRLSIANLLEQTEDAELMQSILTLLQKSLALPGPGIAAFDTDGTPISEEELIASILDAGEEARAGHTIPLSDLKKELLSE